MFPEPIPSPDPLDPMEGTCSHGNREECDKCDAERSAEDCDPMMAERDELDLCIAECRKIVGATSEDIRHDLRLLIEERDRLRLWCDTARNALFQVAIALEEADGGRSGTYENGPARIRALAKARDDAGGEP